ncbi:MAG TPA: MFS transporter [Gaiellales bacterium]
MSSLSQTSGLERYAALFNAPSVRQVVGAGAIGRLPLGMLPLGSVLLVRGAGNSYAVVGVVVAALSLATAVSSPVIGRLADRIGLVRVLVPLAILFPISVSALVLLATQHGPTIATVACAAATGAAQPPIGACIRSLWPSMLPRQDLRETAFALEAWLQELSFVFGPVLVGGIAAVGSPALGMLAAGALTFVGTIWFVLTPPARAASVNLHTGPRSRKGALGSAGVRTVIMSCALVGISFGTVEVTMPAFAELHGTRAQGGIILTCFATGSLIGGIWVGTRRVPSRPDLRFAGMLALLGLTLLPPLVAPSLVVMCAIMLFAGMPIAPAIASSYALVDRLAHAGTSTEAFAWLTTAIVTGMSLGTAVGGVVIERSGPIWALAVAGPASLGAALVVFALRESLRERAVIPSRS